MADSENVTGISETAYAKRRRELMTLISSLRSIGAQAELDLPRIVCIGDQSAGKSSLIEAISRIRVPRDSGTCTRCPMECRLSPSPEKRWSARISLRFEFDQEGKRLAETRTVPFGTSIEDPKAIELWLRRAQSAILDRGTHAHSDFMKMNEEDLIDGARVANQLKFSKNVVCVDISGPELTDLVFIDLPGLIQNAEENMIDLVEKLVTEQIGGNSIILVTLPMSDDLENQKAALLAKKQDPDGLRTIGVLTKPDMLSAGATRSREAWLDVIEGRKHILKHGYYCTRQPEDSDRAGGMSFDAARKAESEFFQKTLPWSNSLKPERFGTRNLTKKLSMLISQQIDENLPKIQADLKTALDLTNAALAFLPPPVTQDVSSELMTLVAKFCAAFGAYVDGARGSERLIQDNRKAYVALKIAIRRSAPDFRPFVTKAESNGEVEDASEVIGDEPLPSQYPLVTAPLYLQDIRNHIKKSETRELPNNIPFPAKVALIERFTSTWEDPIRTCFQTIRGQVSETMTGLASQHFTRFSQLQSQVRGIITDELKRCTQETQNMLAVISRFERFPFTQNDHYFQTCREKLLAHYKAARVGLVENTQGASKRRRTDVSGSTHSANPTPTNPPNPAPTLFTFAKSNANAGKVSTDTTGSSFRWHAANTNSLFGGLQVGAQAAPAFGPGSPTIQPPFKLPPLSVAPKQHPESDNSSSANFNSTENQNEALAALAKIGLHVTSADLQKLIPSDPWEDEMNVAAEVRSYYQTSYKRIIDNVPMTIDNLFLRNLADGMQAALIAGLEIGNKERAAMYLAEDRNITAKREELLTRKRQLESFRQEIFKFGY